MTHISLEQSLAIQQALADATRVRMIRLLLERELCVCEIMAVIEEPQYKVSRHLAVLKQAGLVRDWREGAWMHYEIAPDLPAPWRAALVSLAAAWDESVEVQAALWRLAQRTPRPANTPACCKLEAPANCCHAEERISSPDEEVTNAT